MNRTRRPTTNRLVETSIVVVAVALSIVRFAAIDAGSHSVSDTLRPWLVEVLAIAVVAAATIWVIWRIRGQPITRG